MTAKYVSSARPIATSEVGQFKGNVYRHFIGMARSHTNHGELRVGVVQITERELPKDFRGPPIGKWVAVRDLIEEGWSRACCPLQNLEVDILLCK